MITEATPAPVSAHGAPTPEVFSAHLAIHGESYFPELTGPLRVRLVEAQARTEATLFDFELASRELARSVLVKVPTRGRMPGLPGPGTRLRMDRPTLVSRLPPAVKIELEYVALSALHEHFHRLGDPRFGTVRAFAFLPAQNALVMEKASSTRSLRAALMRSGGRGGVSSPADVEVALRNTGAWLRHYHHLPAPEYAVVRHGQRSDLVDFLQRLADYLGREVGHARFFRRLAANASASALDWLPEGLPLGLGHGDFAPRNILVGPGSRVTGIDTRSRWRTAIYEDLGHFLATLSVGGLQRLNPTPFFGPPSLQQQQRVFLEGYFAQEPIPHQALRLYELLALLDMASGLALIRAEAPGLGARLLRTARLALFSGRLRMTLRHLLSPTAPR